MFSGLQSAHKESHSADAAILKEQIHQMLREWHAEVNVPSPASSLQNSRGTTGRPCIRRPRRCGCCSWWWPRRRMPKQAHNAPIAAAGAGFSSKPKAGARQEVEMPNLNQQCEVVVGDAAPSQQSLGQGVQGDCGEIAVVANAMFNEQVKFTCKMVYIFPD